MKKYEVWGYVGNPCEYKMKCKVIEAENSDKAIKKSRIRNVTQVVLIKECFKGGKLNGKNK